MEIDEFLRLARKRRSIRRFRPGPVPDDYVDKILEAARWAPSGANGQPWEFIVIKNQEAKEKLAEAYFRYSEIVFAVELTRSQEYRQPAFRVEGSPEAQTAAIRERFTVWSDAPVIIAVLGDQRAMQASTLAARLYEYHTFDQNLTTANYAIHLAAAALGLGAQWVSIPWPCAEEMKPILGIPAVLTLFTLNPIGYSDIKPVPYRRELGDMVHLEKYDMSKFRSNNDVQEYIRYQRQRHTAGGTYATEGKPG
jgi:5,6-dimethylbenzimidazole synthase